MADLLETLRGRPVYPQERGGHATFRRDGGWWDAENLGGALDVYDRMEPLDERGISSLVVGPWSQRFVADRPDVLSFVSDPLTEDLVVSGRIVARHFASTTGTDSDRVVELIDVSPERHAPTPELGGLQQVVADDVLRGKLRVDIERPTAIEPGALQADARREERHGAHRGTLAGSSRIGIAPGDPLQAG